MHSEIEVIGRRSIDGAVDVVAHMGADVHGHTTACEVTQDESEGHPLSERGICGGWFVEARQDHAVIRRNAGDGREGEEEAGGCAASFAGAACGDGDPVCSERLQRDRNPSPVHETDRDVRPCAAQRPQPRAQVQPCDPQPFGLGVQHRALRFPLGGQLAFEVFEQSVPVHPTERRRPRSGAYELSTFFAPPHSGAGGTVLYCSLADLPDREFDMTPHEYFAPQPTSTSELPDPVPLLRSLTHGVLEVLAGVREVDQLARWFSEDAFRSLVTRANLSSRARSARGVAPARPTFEIRALRVTEPLDGVIEAVVVVAGPGRTRAVAVRLEGIDRRWRATSLAIL